MSTGIRWSVCSATLLLAAFPASAQQTLRASVDSSGAEGNGASGTFSVISGNGRFVAFRSSATNLVAGDTNGFSDAFVYDRLTLATERVSIDSSGAEANNDSALFGLSISADGRFVVYQSRASNLVPGYANGYNHIYIRDRQTSMTEVEDTDSTGVEGNGHSRYVAISADGNLVAFGSAASNLVASDTNAVVDIFVHDRTTLVTERVSVDSYGAEANLPCTTVAISADGRYVAFDSTASNLVAGDTNGVKDVFVHDRVTLITERVSVDSSGAEGNGDSANPSISADGRYVVFDSAASNLVAGDTNGVRDVFLYDRLTGTTERISIDSTGAQAGGQSLNPSVCGDGRFVAFESAASNLVPGDTNAVRDIFERDRLNGTTMRVSVDTYGAQGDGLSLVAWISANGGAIAFQSNATTLVPGDTNGYQDVFVRDMGNVSPATDICQAGTGTVLACPCSNPPANSPRGCDNSAGTGGAQLTSTGTASLSMDTVVFVTNGEKPTATSIVLQGTVEVANGLQFGQGVRCAGGSLKRLYVKSASGGSITAPGAGDPSVSLRSAILNQPIPPGASRWYAVYYRDPVVLGGCPAANTFNITQTQLIAWAP